MLFNTAPEIVPNLLEHVVRNSESSSMLELHHISLLSIHAPVSLRNPLFSSWLVYFKHLLEPQVLTANIY